jgi:4,5:9,10-diseco-3-hydroxy-5,9,17-trioxoandrosta-1(10),2-diene-4-oate hydrolase
MSTFSIPEGKYVDIGNVAGHPQRVHYHEQGSGDPVIFLHGAGTGASGYSNFKGNYPEFAAAGFRSIVPDLLGYGLSSKTEEPRQYDMDFFIAGVKGLVDQLGLKNITLLGNCWAAPWLWAMRSSTPKTSRA